MGIMVAASSEVLLAVVSILFSVCILLIPFLAKRIVEGDVGSTMLTVLGTTSAMAQAMMSMAAGPGDGWSRVGGAGGGGGGEKGAPSAAGGTAPSGPPSGRADVPPVRTVRRMCRMRSDGLLVRRQL
jgi:hypothetical protein